MDRGTSQTLTSMTCSTPSRMTLTPRSSFFSLRTWNWRSFCQSFKDPTTTWLYGDGHQSGTSKVSQTTYNNENGNHDGETFNPINWGLARWTGCAKILKEAQGEGDHGGNRQKNLSCVILCCIMSARDGVDVPRLYLSKLPTLRRAKFCLYAVGGCSPRKYDDAHLRKQKTGAIRLRSSGERDWPASFGHLHLEK
jgi:hypothetical protein